MENISRTFFHFFSIEYNFFALFFIVCKFSRFDCKQKGVITKVCWNFVREMLRLPSWVLWRLVNCVFQNSRGGKFLRELHLLMTKQKNISAPFFDFFKNIFNEIALHNCENIYDLLYAHSLRKTHKKLFPRNFQYLI